MDPKKLFCDRRLSGFCIYCGAFPDTRDHIPSKVLLDEPYPAALHVVSCCRQCNNSFSHDEVYLACLVECVIHGTSNPEELTRPKIKRIMQEKNHIRESIEECKEKKTNPLIWIPDDKRVKNVVMKLARGHVAYELGEPQMADPEYVSIWPYGAISNEALANFERAPTSSAWPEIGSRAFINLLIANNNIIIENGWNVIQRSLYRYMITYDGSITVRIVISEYLFCEISF